MARINCNVSVTSAVILLIMATTIIPLLITQNAYAETNHSIVANTYPIAAAESVSIPFTVPSGVTNAYLSGTVLVTGGLWNDIDFGIVNTDTGAQIIRQTYNSQGNIGMYLPAGSYNIVLHNGAILAGEIHTATLTLNLSY